MITITDQIVEICKGVTERAYRSWPQKGPKTPYAVVDPIGRNVELVDRDGSEIRVRLTYNISVMADKPSVCEDVVGRIADELAHINFHTTGVSSTYEDPNHFYRMNLTVDGAVDRRGDSFA